MFLHGISLSLHWDTIALRKPTWCDRHASAVCIMVDDAVRLITKAVLMFSSLQSAFKELLLSII